MQIIQEGTMLSRAWHVTIIYNHPSPSYSKYHVFEVEKYKFLSGNSKLAKISYLKEKLSYPYGLSENVQIHFRASQLQKTKLA